MTAAHELGASVGAWNALVRRARIGRDRKAAAFVLSSYAKANGTEIHCGVARLAVDLECSHRTARRYLAWLRKVGLVELVREGNRRRGHSDEYRLILGPDVLENLEVPDPEVYRSMCDDVQDSRNSRSVTSGGPVDNSDQGSSLVSPDLAVAPDYQGSSLVSHDDADQGSNGARSGVTLDDPPPSLYTSPGRSTSQADDGDIRTDLALAGPPTRNGSPQQSVVVELFPGASLEPPYVRPPGATRAQEVIAEAMARRAAAREAKRTEESS